MVPDVPPMKDEVWMNGPRFHGWYMVGAVHLLLALIFGAAYSFGAFFTHLQANFDADRFSTASIFSSTALIYYVVGVFSGTWSDRTSVRTVVSLGILLLSLGFLAGSLLSSSLALFLTAFCSLVGLGIGLVYVPAVSTLQRWFVIHRSSASGLALAGTGLGTLVGPTVAGLLMQHLSWQSTMRLFAAGIAVLGLAAAACLRGKPEDLGQRPDGLPPSGTTTIDGPKPRCGDTTLRDAVRQARFWWFFLAIFFGSVGLFLALVHINPYAQQHGLETTRANLLIGLIGVGNIGGRLVLGRIGDRMGAQRFLIVVTLGLALLCGPWAMARGFASLSIFALLFGAANGGCIALYPAVATTWFGTSHLGAILGALYIAVGIAAVAGGSVAGFLYDLYHSYTLSIVLSGLSALLSAVGIILAARFGPRHP